MIFDYSNVINYIGDYELYEEDDHIYFMPIKPICNANMLIQEKDDCIIIWSNEITKVDELELYQIMHRIIPSDIIFPFIETESLLAIVNKLGAVKYDFHDQQESDMCNLFGSYILRHKDQI